MHHKKNEVLKKIEEFKHKSHNRGSMNKAIGLPRMQKRLDFVEKSNKKYKITANKKRREDLLEEEDMMKLYWRRKYLS